MATASLKCIISFIQMKTLPLMWKTFTGPQGTRYNYKSLIHYLVSRDKICFCCNSSEVRVMPKINSLIKYCLEKIPCYRNKTKRFHTVKLLGIFSSRKNKVVEKSKWQLTLGKKSRYKTSSLVMQSIRVVVLVVLAKILAESTVTKLCT